MIYRGPDFFAASYDMAYPTPLPHVSKSDRRRHTGRLRKRDNLLAGEGPMEPKHIIARKPGPLKLIHYSLGQLSLS
jgi:hypothetical protein